MSITAQVQWRASLTKLLVAAVSEFSGKDAAVEGLIDDHIEATRGLIVEVLWHLVYVSDPRRLDDAVIHSYEFLNTAGLTYHDTPNPRRGNDVYLGRHPDDGGRA